MSEYVSKEWLKEHIEVISYEGMWHETETDEFVSVENIDSAPSIDIVRCKECIDFVYDEQYKCYGCASDNGLMGEIKPDDFCSHGERETSDE